MTSNKHFAAYAVSLTLATVAAITYALSLGGINLMGDMTVHGVIAELSLSLLIRGYTVGRLPFYNFDGGHWTLRGEK